MSTRSKGRGAEKEVEEILLKEGCIVFRVKGSTKFNRSVDMFKLFDMEAIEKHPTFGIVVRRIQVKHQQPSMIPFREFYKLWCDESPKHSVEIWVKVRYKGWRIFKSPDFTVETSVFKLFGNTHNKA